MNFGRLPGQRRNFVSAASRENNSDKRRFFALLSAVKCRALLVFFICASVNLMADTGEAVIFYADGSDFYVTLGSKRTVYSAPAAAGRISLPGAGIVQTSYGTFLEMQLPSGAVVKLSENSSLVYNGVDSAGNFSSLSLLYGRIRIVTGGASGTLPFAAVYGGGISAKIVSGDFGIDYLFEQGRENAQPKPVFGIHAFRGRAEIFPFESGEAPAYFGELQSIAVEENESLFIHALSAHTYTEKKPLENEIIDYWTRYNFAGSAPQGMPPAQITRPVAEVTVAALPQVSPAPHLTDMPALPESSVSRAGFRGGNPVAGIGLAMIASSAAVQGFSYSRFIVSGNESMKTVFAAAYVPMGLGVIITLLGILYNPASSVR